MLSAIVALASGLVVGALAVWMRRGKSEKSRFWTRSQAGFIDDRFAFLLLPALTCLLVAAGLAGLAWALLDGAAQTLLVALAGIGGAAGIVLAIWSLLPLRVPNWLVPSWRQEMLGRRD